MNNQQHQFAPTTLIGGVALMTVLTVMAPARWWVWVPLGVVFVALTNHPAVIQALDATMRREGL